jgi:ABC-2 type transport system ATP-binding protein
VARLRVESLVVHNRRQLALNGLTFEAGDGVLGILGPNGAGKTTLLRLLAGLRKADSGSVTFDDHDLRSRSGMSIVRGALGFQPQAPVFTNGFTVLESVRYAAWLKGLNKRETSRKVDRALEATHLTDVASRPVRRLSGGQQKRAAIAQAIVHTPRLLLLDEPTAAIDPAERRSVLDVIRDLGEQTTLLLSTHITSDLRAADGVLVLGEGRSRFCGTKSEFHGLADSTESDVWESAYAAVCSAA